MPRAKLLGNNNYEPKKFHGCASTQCTRASYATVVFIIEVAKYSSSIVKVQSHKSRERDNKDMRWEAINFK